MSVSCWVLAVQLAYFTPFVFKAAFSKITIFGQRPSISQRSRSLDLSTIDLPKIATFRPSIKFFYHKIDHVINQCEAMRNDLISYFPKLNAISSIIYNPLPMHILDYKKKHILFERQENHSLNHIPISPHKKLQELIPIKYADLWICFIHGCLREQCLCRCVMIRVQRVRAYTLVRPSLRITCRVEHSEHHPE